MNYTSFKINFRSLIAPAFRSGSGNIDNQFDEGFSTIIWLGKYISFAV